MAILHYEDYDTIFKAYKPFKDETQKVATNVINKKILDEFRYQRGKFKVSPKDDFYTYVNSAWIKFNEKSHTLKNKYNVKYDDFGITQDKVYEELYELVRIKMKSDKNIDNIYNSGYFRSIQHNQEVEKHITNMIIKVDQFIKNDDLYGLLADINIRDNASIISPILWKLGPDLKNPSVYINSFSQPSFPFYDPNIYIDKPDDSKKIQNYKKDFRKHYVATINDLFNKVIIKHDTTGYKHCTTNGEIARDIAALIYRQFTENPIEDDSPDGYNKVNASDSLKKYGFDWPQFAKKIGYKIVPSNFTCDNLSYLKNIMTILNTSWKSPEWRVYWLQLYARQQIRLHTDYINIYFNFYRKYVVGTEVKFPKEIFAMMLLSLTHNKFLSTEYTKKYAIEENVVYAKNMANDLRHVFIKIIERNNWMKPETRRQALLKLAHLKFYFGENGQILDDPNLDYSPIDYLGNLEKIQMWRMTQFIRLCGKPLVDMPGVDWNNLRLAGRQTYIVNAYYTPFRNDIYVPIAYLQKPFLNIHDHGIDYNTAYFGKALSHEISHSLDSTGSLFDYKGVFKDWWTDTDRDIFDSKVKNITRQYEAFALLDGLDYDATISASENMADILSVVISEEYLKQHQFKNSQDVPDNYIVFSGFYTYCAIQFRQVIRKKSLTTEMKSNPHPLDKYRVNVPLSRLPLFNTIYNIGPKDKMYWSDKSSIW
jgi:putative endopeptidase